MHRLDGNDILDGGSLLIAPGRSGTLDIGGQPVDLFFETGGELMANWAIDGGRVRLTFAGFDNPLGSAVQFDQLMHIGGRGVTVALVIRTTGAGDRLYRTVEFVAYYP